MNPFNRSDHLIGRGLFLGENLRKSCMKRENSLKIATKNVRHKSDDRSLLEDVSIHSLALEQMILQKEDEFYLFHRQQQQQSTSSSDRQTNEKNQRRSSETDLRWPAKCRQNLQQLPVSASFGGRPVIPHSNRSRMRHAVNSIFV